MYYLTPICCVCFESNKNLHNLNDKYNQQLMQKFQYCTNGIDNVEPGVPVCMCNNCLHNLNVAYEFKKSCATNIARLRSYVTQLEQCKLATDADIKDIKQTISCDENGPIVYSDIQVNIARCSPTLKLSFINFKPTISVVKSIKTEFEPVLEECVNISDKDCKVDAIENESLYLSEIIKKEHDITITDSVKQLIKNEVLADEENYLNQLVKEVSMMQASPVNDTPTSASLQSAEEFDVGPSKLNSSNKLFGNAKSEMITKSSDAKDVSLDVDRGVAAAAKGRDSPRGQRTPQTKRQVSARRSAKSKTVLKSKSDLLYKCNTCHKEFSALDDLQKHLLKHRPRDQSCRCPVCGLSLSRKDHLLRHLRIHSENRNRYKCTLCPKHFSTNYYLKCHITRTHKTQCSKCKQKFKSNKALLLHRKKEHFTEFYFTCNLCGKVLNEYRSHQLHMRTHKDGTPFQCAHCPKSYNNNKRLKEHMNLKHYIGKLRCQNCGIHLEKSMLDEHMKTHEAELPHVCPECGKSFTRKVDFRVHVKKHNVENCFKCEQCGKIYLQFLWYKYHLLTHSETKSNSV